VANRDAEVTSLKQKLEQSKQHVVDRRKDIELLKKEILAHSRREGELQRELSQSTSNINCILIFFSSQISI
jgi:chromosome segregation ATPase